MGVADLTPPAAWDCSRGVDRFVIVMSSRQRSAYQIEFADCDGTSFALLVPRHVRSHMIVLGFLACGHTGNVTCSERSATVFQGASSGTWGS